MTNLIPANHKKGVFANQTIVLPFIGEKKFNEDGSIDVELEEKELEDFLLATKDYFGFTDPLVKRKPEDDDTEDYLDMVQLVESASLTELAAFAGELKMDMGKVSAMTTEKLKKEILKNYKKAKK